MMFIAYSLIYDVHSIQDVEKESVLICSVENARSVVQSTRPIQPPIKMSFDILSVAFISL